MKRYGVTKPEAYQLTGALFFNCVFSFITFIAMLILFSYIIDINSYHQCVTDALIMSEFTPAPPGYAAVRLWDTHT